MATLYPMLRHTIVGGLLLILLSVTCALSAQTPGEVTDSVRCTDFEEESYALFLPSAYTEEKEWPVIYIFEPAARGRLPIDIYKEIADQYGILLVSSNVSKNGSWEVSFASAERMLNDTRSKFSIDSEAIFTAGFSGGSRVALALATTTDHVKGVIGCGAGLPVPEEYKPIEGAKFLYAGAIGDRDMNFLEMHELRKHLHSLKIQNRLFTFEGPHQWPPAEKMSEILGWLLDPSHSGPDPFELEKESKEGLKSIKEREKIFKREADLQDKYINAIAEQLKSPNDSVISSFWKTETDFLNRMLKNKDVRKSNLAARLINKIWVACYENGRDFVAGGNHYHAATVHKIWSILQPENIYPWFILAQNKVVLGKNEEAIDCLESAFEIGMSDADRLESHPILGLLKGNTRFENLLQNIRDKKQ